MRGGAGFTFVTNSLYEFVPSSRPQIEAGNPSALTNVELRTLLRLHYILPSATQVEAHHVYNGGSNSARVTW